MQKGRIGGTYTKVSHLDPRMRKQAFAEDVKRFGAKSAFAQWHGVAHAKSPLALNQIMATGNKDNELRQYFEVKNYLNNIEYTKGLSLIPDEVWIDFKPNNF